MSVVVTSFASLIVKTETKVEIAKLRQDLQEECNAAIGHRDWLDDLADRYFADAQEAYKRGFEGLTEQYLWASRWATALENLNYDTFPNIVHNLKTPVSFTGELISLFG